ncbi:MAG: PAS domain S-box protein, partial [Elainellaceae cyanobacterium]
MQKPQTERLDLPLKQLLDQVYDLVQVVMPSGRLLYANDTWQKVLGYSADEALDLHWLDVVHPESRDRLLHTLQSLQEGKIVPPVDVTLISRSGRLIPASGILDYHNTPSQTEQIWCLWQPQESSATNPAPRIPLEQFHPVPATPNLGAQFIDTGSLLEHLPVGVVQRSLDGQITAANTAAAHLFGYDSVDALIQASVAAHAPNAASLHDANPHYANPKHWQSLLVQLKDEGKISQIKTQIRRCNDQFLWVSESGQLVCDRHNTPLYYEGIIEDISREQRLHAYLERTNQALEGQPHLNATQTLGEQKQAPTPLPQHGQQVEEFVREARLQAIFDNASVGIVTLDPCGRILEANAALEAMLGYSQPELMCKTLFHFTLAEDLTQDIASFQSLIDGTQEQYSIERRCLRKDGEHLWVRLTTATVCDESRYPCLILGIIEKISEQKQAQAALHDSKMQFQSLVSNVPGMIFRLAQSAIDTGSAQTSQRQFSFSYVSPGCQDIFEMEAQAMIDSIDSVFECIFEDDLQTFHSSLARSAHSLAPWLWEGRILLKSGDLKWIQAMAQPQRRPDSSTLWDGVLMDITSRKQVEDRLRLLESVVTNANDSILITEAEPLADPGPRIVYANPAFTQNTGYQLDEVLGKTPRLLQGEKTDRHAIKAIRDALIQWTSVKVELINYRKDGSEFWVEMIIVPINDASGWTTHWMAIQRDITERKHLEEELLKALAKERDLSDLKSRFISTTSHEFRTPLTTIMSSVEILHYFENSQEEEKELFQQVYDSIQHMTRLLDDVLFIGRAEGDRLELEGVELDLDAFCKDSVVQAQRSFGKNHLIAFSQDGTPSPAFLDSKLLRQMLNNLLSNAVKYSEPHSRIALNLTYGEDSCILQVQDEGIGIPLDDQARLFGFFHRGSNVGAIPGTGLGLAIVKKSID